MARPDLQAASPVSVVTQESIKLSGTSGVEDYLRDIPQAVAAWGSATNNGNEGAATVDLRNLGEERTLVLVDGKRFVPYDSNGVVRSEEPTSELQSLIRIPYAAICFKTKKKQNSLHYSGLSYQFNHYSNYMRSLTD